MKQPKALFLDVDGTLLNRQNQITPRVKACIRRALEAGALVIPATGRAWEALEPLYRKLGLQGPAICYNGAVILESAGGKPLKEQLVNEEAAKAAISLARKEDIHILGFRYGKLYYEREREEVEEYFQRTNIPGNIINFDTLSPLNLTKALMAAPHERLEPIKQQLEDLFPREKLSITFSDPRYLEILPGGADKGTALKEICRLKGILPQDTLAAGDSWNDEALLRAAGTAVLMGDAPQEMKERFPPEILVPSSDEDGLAVFLEKIF